MPYKIENPQTKIRKKSIVKEYNRRRPEGHKFYNTARWKKLREYVKKRNPFCAECLRNGLYKQGEIVDHIIPIEEGGAAMDIENLQVLCRACHNRKHGEGRSKS